MMSPAMRARLTRNIDYHSAMQDHHLEEDKKEKEAHPPAAPQRGTAPVKPPPSTHEKLAAMHGDVVKQLADVLANDPPTNAVGEALLSPRPLRDEGGRFRPDAGYWTKPVLH